MDETMKNIAAGLSAMGIVASEAAVTLLGRHLALVYETNKDLNLTAIPESSGPVMHVLDSAVALPYLADAPEGAFADLGSGAGFPGIPLSVLSEREVALVESVRKKAAFLERVSEALCLKATVHPVRAEELALERRGAFAAVTARALTALPSLVELAAPLLMNDGLLICLKGDPDPSEIERGDLVAAAVGTERVGLQNVAVPGLEAVRTIVVYRRTGAPRTRLPRRNGMAQRQPLH